MKLSKVRPYLFYFIFWVLKANLQKMQMAEEANKKST
jgi:hypothetical protein